MMVVYNSNVLINKTKKYRNSIKTMIKQITRREEQMIKEAENFKTVETVRERERELQFSEISFIFDAKNHLNNTEILNIVNNIKRIGYVEEIKRFLLQNSLSFL